MKRMISGFCCAAMLLSLAACGGGKAGETPTPESKAPSTESQAPAPETTVDQATFEELLEAGKKNGNKLTIYSTHSVTVSAVEALIGRANV